MRQHLGLEPRLTNVQILLWKAEITRRQDDLTRHQAPTLICHVHLVLMNNSLFKHH